MSNEIELISDGDGLAVIGSPTDIDLFLRDQGLSTAPSRELDLHRIRSAANTGGSLVQAGSELVQNSGRWVKLTKDSADAVARYGLMPTKKAGIGHAMIGLRPGHSQRWLQIEKAPLLLGGPVALGLAATMIQQQAMQQQMDEIVEYLQEINEKVDDILRGQKDAVIADLIAVGVTVDDAMTVRDQVGRVPEITWSKVQGTSFTVARTEAYALRQLEGIAEDLHAKADAADIAKEAKEAEKSVREWLTVLARSVQLEDAIALLELDRVLDESPEELEQHRLGLINARQKRRELIARNTDCLLMEMEDAARRANSKVLFSPFKSPAAVRSSNQVSADLLSFRARLGIESGHQECEARRWGQAAAEVRDKVLTSTAEGVDAARRFGADSLSHAANALRPAETESGTALDPGALPAVEDGGAGAASADDAQAQRELDARYKVFSYGTPPDDLEPETPDA